MRALIGLLVVAASGCSLYYSHESADDYAPIDGGRPFPYPDARPADDAGVPGDASPGGDTMARCEDGQLFQVPVPPIYDEPAPHGAGRPIGRCAGACRSAAALCTSAGCEEEAHSLCTAPISLGATCSLAGTACRGTGSIDCPETTACSNAVVGSTCSCTSGTYRCAQATPAATTQARLVGKWHGTVTTPWLAPYPITLWIYPDGTYWPDDGAPHRAAFYYGGDGPSPGRRLEILSTSSDRGSWADIAIDFSAGAPILGSLTALVIDDTTLRFTYSASWLSCGQPISVELTRY